MPPGEFYARNTMDLGLNREKSPEMFPGNEAASRWVLSRTIPRAESSKLF